MEFLNRKCVLKEEMNYRTQFLKCLMRISYLKFVIHSSSKAIKLAAAAPGRLSVRNWRTSWTTPSSRKNSTKIGPDRDEQSFQEMRNKEDFQISFVVPTIGN